MTDLYRFEPTGEVRAPKKGEPYLWGDVMIYAFDDHSGVNGPYPIFRRVPHEDTIAATRNFDDSFIHWLKGDWKSDYPQYADDTNLGMALAECAQETERLLADTSCELAFARMCCAYKSFEHQHDGAVHALYKRMCDGERSPELTAAMTDLTQRMKGKP
jgi:hypothetical protein